MPPKDDDKPTMKSFFGIPRKVTKSGDNKKLKSQTRWSGDSAQPQTHFKTGKSKDMHRIPKSAYFDVIHYCLHRWKYGGDDNNS
jgi:hypothetical protein